MQNPPIQPVFSAGWEENPKEEKCLFVVETAGCFVVLLVGGFDMGISEYGVELGDA